jgi:hypothetical protein
VFIFFPLNAGTFAEVAQYLLIGNAIPFSDALNDRMKFIRIFAEVIVLFLFLGKGRDRKGQ